MKRSYYISLRIALLAMPFFIFFKSVIAQDTAVKYDDAIEEFCVSENQKVIVILDHSGKIGVYENGKVIDLFNVVDYRPLQVLLNKEGNKLYVFGDQAESFFLDLFERTRNNKYKFSKRILNNYHNKSFVKLFLKNNYIILSSAFTSTVIDLKKNNKYELGGYGKIKVFDCEKEDFEYFIFSEKGQVYKHTFRNRKTELIYNGKNYFNYLIMKQNLLVWGYDNFIFIHEIKVGSQTTDSLQLDNSWQIDWQMFKYSNEDKSVLFGNGMYILTLKETKIKIVHSSYFPINIISNGLYDNSFYYIEDWNIMRISDLDKMR